MSFACHNTNLEMALLVCSVGKTIGGRHFSWLSLALLSCKCSVKNEMHRSELRSIRFGSNECGVEYAQCLASFRALYR